jgi:hypothetical protein
MDPCEHSQHHGLSTCPGLTPEEVAFGEKVRSAQFSFVGGGGRENWHDGPTNREWEKETIENAARYDVDVQYNGSRSARISNDVHHG